MEAKCKYWHVTLPNRCAGVKGAFICSTCSALEEEEANGNKAELTPDKANILQCADDFMCWFIANYDIKNEYDISCEFIRALYIAQGRGS